MDKVDFLQCLKAFTEAATATLALPLQRQRESDAVQSRAPEVYLMRLPNSTASKKYVPYILHTVITGQDAQAPGQNPESTVTVRTIFAVYHEDEQEGGLALLNLMERVRLALLRCPTIGRRYRLDLTHKLEGLIYPDDTAPYFLGEMSSVWQLPVVKEEIPQ